MAVFRRKPLIHGEQGDGGNCKQDPESVDEVHLQPEGHNNGENCYVVEDENETPEGHHAEIGMTAVNLPHIVEEEGHDDNCKDEWHGGSLLWLLWREIIGDFLQQLVVFSHARVGSLRLTVIKVNIEDTKVKLVSVQSSGVGDVHHHFVVAIDLARDQVPEVEVNLESLD